MKKLLNICCFLHFSYAFYAKLCSFACKKVEVGHKIVVCEGAGRRVQNRMLLKVVFGVAKCASGAEFGWFRERRCVTPKNATCGFRSRDVWRDALRRVA